MSQQACPISPLLGFFENSFMRTILQHSLVFLIYSFIGFETFLLQVHPLYFKRAAWDISLVSLTTFPNHILEGNHQVHWKDLNGSQAVPPSHQHPFQMPQCKKQLLQYHLPYKMPFLQFLLPAYVSFDGTLVHKNLCCMLLLLF